LRLLCTEALKVLAKAVAVTLPEFFTGKITITLNFHVGQVRTATVGYEEGQKFD